MLYKYNLHTIYNSCMDLCMYKNVHFSYMASQSYVGICACVSVYS